MYQKCLSLFLYKYNLLEFLSASGGCGNVGEDVDLSVKVTAQYLPIPAEITWQNMAGDKVGLASFLLLVHFMVLISLFILNATIVY